MKRRFLLLCLGCLSPLITDASLIERDYQSANDGLITYDDVTGLEWLDLTATDGKQPASLLESLPTYGWRIATRADVNTLITGNLDDNAEISAFISLFGSTYDENGTTAGSVAWGRFLDGNGEGSMDSFYVRDDSFPFRYGFLEDAPSIWQPNIFMGTFFLREVSTVPLPSTLWLFGTGLVGLSVLRNRRLSSR